MTTRDTVTATADEENGATGATSNNSTNVEREIECVFVESNGKVELRPVKTGIQDNTYIEIKEGLKAGERIVTGPYSSISRMLENNDAVEVVEKDQLYSGSNGQ